MMKKSGASKLGAPFGMLILASLYWLPHILYAIASGQTESAAYSVAYFAILAGCGVLLAILLAAIYKTLGIRFARKSLRRGVLVDALCMTTVFGLSHWIRGDYLAWSGPHYLQLVVLTCIVAAAVRVFEIFHLTRGNDADKSGTS